MALSNDESAVLMISLLFGPVGWGVFFYRLAGVRSPRGREPQVLIPGAVVAAFAVVVACVIGLAIVLMRYAADDVRSDTPYILMYLFLGLAWLRAGEFCFAYAGLSLRDDAVERGNNAAVPALGGALMAVTLCYAGGNVGSGPGWWVVLFSAALASACLALVWLVLEWTSKVSDLVTIERDVSAGVRFGGLLLACGMILGYGVAGDWHSTLDTLQDFGTVAWAVASLAAAAIGVERLARPTISRPRPPLLLAGVLPAAAYILLAAAYVRARGWPV